MILDKENTPASIIAEMEKVKKIKGRFYQHWSFKDNPILTTEMMEEAQKQFPVGSFYHTTKILGERGTPNKLIYLDYFTPKLIKKIVDKPRQEIDLTKEVSIRDFTRFIVGCDIGASKALNSFTLTGFTYDFSKVGFIDKLSFKSLGYQDKKINLIQFIKKWLERGINIELISIDSAEANFIRDLQSEFKSLNLPTVIPKLQSNN